MIPGFGLGDVLPPFLGSDVTGQLDQPRSPYPATLAELVDTFCTSPERAEVLRGFINLRDALRAEGFMSGFQWVDGSFVENCEVNRGRPPSDVDVVSVLRRPPEVAAPDEWHDFVGKNVDTLFNSQWTKGEFKCDGYYIDLDSDPELIAELAAYWIGLFSHQRDSFRWKGLVRVDFGPGDDSAALALIEQREKSW